MPAMFHRKFGPSTDLWVCEHGISYPDLCEQCGPAIETDVMKTPGIRGLYVIGKILILLAGLPPAERSVTWRRVSILLEAAGYRLAGRGESTRS